MEIVKYICEFFFGNFWHFLGLLLLCETIGGYSAIRFIHKGKEKERIKGKEYEK